MEIINWTEFGRAALHLPHYIGSTDQHKRTFMAQGRDNNEDGPQDAATFGEQHWQFVARSCAVALASCHRTGRNASIDIDSYQKQAMNAREQASRTKFREIQDLLLSIAVKYERLALLADRITRSTQMLPAGEPLRKRALPEA